MITEIVVRVTGTEQNVNDVNDRLQTVGREVGASRIELMSQTVIERDPVPVEEAAPAEASTEGAVEAPAEEGKE